MPEEHDYLTKEKYEEFEKELQTLKHDKRKEVAKNLEYAKSLGDLSENAEYHAAREAQAVLEDRIKKLEMLLKHAEVVEKHHVDDVSVGSEVTIKRKDNGTEFTYVIVGSEEVDMGSGKISNRSPLGSAILGKKKKEEFSVETPAGKVTYTIVSIK
ncbi:MAG: transcription elongation factor GreA [Candidatus Pacebacteria bacterium]|nr:transcription elongation factor GreA [Candidatus Paceibacterota bacterium]